MNKLFISYYYKNGYEKKDNNAGLIFNKRLSLIVYNLLCFKDVGEN